MGVVAVSVAAIEPQAEDSMTTGGRITRRGALALTVTASAAWLAACATPDRGLNAPMRAALGSIAGVVLVPQTGLDVTVTPTDGGQGGLLGVLVAAAIDSHRESSARERSGPILKALADHDFRREITQALAEESARQARVPLRGAWRLETVDTDSQRRALLDAATEDAVLFLRVDYKLESGNVVVLARAQLVPRAPALMGHRPSPKEGAPLDEGNALFLRSFRFTQNNVTADNVAAALTAGARNVVSQCLSELGRDA